jgi:acyl carrier protein
MEAIKRDLVKIVGEVNPKIILRNESDYARRFKDLGIDSLDMMSILLTLQEHYGIEIPDADVDSLNTLGDVVAYVTKALKPRS